MTRRLSFPGVAFFFFIIIPTFFPKTLEVTRKSRIFAEDNQKSCISLIISIVVSTVLFMVTI